MDNQEPQEAEEQELIQYKQTPKFNLFVEYYTKPGYTVITKTGEEKSTQWNATLSAIKAYDLDPDKQYSYATRWGTSLVAKCSFLARDILEANGVTMEKLIIHAVNKMATSDRPDWWDRIMEIAEYKKQIAASLVQTNNTQINNYNLNGQEVKDFNKEFQQFLEQQGASSTK